MDGIAISPDSGVVRRIVHFPELASFTSPFAVATRAGQLLFTSCIAGVNPATGELVSKLSDLSPDDRNRASSIDPLTPYVEPFVAQHFAMWHCLRLILAVENMSEASIFYYKTWLRRSMRDVSHAYLTDIFARLAGTEFCFTRFPVAALRIPGALVEGRFVALSSEGAARKIVKVPPHGISSFYVGTVQIGNIVMTAGEVPIDTEAQRVITHATELPGEMRRLQLGRVHKELPIMAQADYIYGLLEKALATHGAGLDDVVHQSVYMVDVAEYPALERIAALRFGSRLPATSCIPIVGASPFIDTRLEVEVTAQVASS